MVTPTNNNIIVATIKFTDIKYYSKEKGGGIDDRRKQNYVYLFYGS